MFDDSSRKADHPIASHFVTRHSPRAFNDRPVTEAQMLSLFEAARWAPSTSNIQPWRFAYALRNEQGFDNIFNALVEFNQIWAGKAGALVVIASVASALNADGETKQTPNHQFDTGTAWGYLALQAHHDGLVAHAMAGFDPAKLAEAVSLPEGYVIHAVVAVGYHGAIEALPERMHKGEEPNGRKPLAETVSRGGF